MITEAEARKKWCPFVRSLGYLGEGSFAVANRDAPSVTEAGLEPDNNPESCRCIASDCMQGCDEDGNWRGFCGLGIEP